MNDDLPPLPAYFLAREQEDGTMIATWREKELRDYARLAVAQATERLRAERDALLELLRDVSAVGGLANDLVRDRVDAAIDAAKERT